MSLDIVNVVLIVLAVVLGVAYFSIRTARKQKESRSGSGKKSF